MPLKIKNKYFLFCYADIRHKIRIFISGELWRAFGFQSSATRKMSSKGLRNNHLRCLTSKQPITDLIFSGDIFLVWWTFFVLIWRQNLKRNNFSLDLLETTPRIFSSLDMCNQNTIGHSSVREFKQTVWVLSIPIRDLRFQRVEAGAQWQHGQRVYWTVFKVGVIAEVRGHLLPLAATAPPADAEEQIRAGLSQRLGIPIRKGLLSFFYSIAARNNAMMTPNNTLKSSESQLSNAGSTIKIAYFLDDINASNM